MNIKTEPPRLISRPYMFLCLCGIGVVLGVFFCLPKAFAVTYSMGGVSTRATLPVIPQLDTHEYDMRLLALAHVATSSPWHAAFLQGTTTLAGQAASTTTPKPLWPVRRVYPNNGALLPFNRIVAYYGNFYSKGMGVLGQYPEDVVLSKLTDEAAKWTAADPATPVVPAIEYIDVTAQGSPGKDGTYRLRMPDTQIDKALALAAKINGIVILDIQVGLSTVAKELPLLDKYLAMPQVHVALDPEFAMHGKTPPGRVIGTMSAEDINYAASYLAKIVREKNLPPKILIVHRFTQEMVTGYKRIAPLPEVQIVMDMDGWGFPAKKLTTYNTVIGPEPVQFTGIKLFYKNDTLKPSTGLLSTTTILSLTPAPIFIQYQ